MSIPPYLSELPQVGDLIRKIERYIARHSNGHHPGYCECHPSTPEQRFEAQWNRYPKFLKAGRDSGQLPPLNPLKETPPEDADSAVPFSPLAMRLAHDICGYKHDQGTPDRFQRLVDAMLDSAKAELKSVFMCTEAPLAHLQPSSLLAGLSKQKINLTDIGELAATSVQNLIINGLRHIRVWCEISDQLKKVDWNDIPLLRKLGSEPSFATDNDRLPLCAIVDLLQRHERTSSAHVESWFDHWWNTQPATLPSTPSSGHLYLRKASKGRISEREIQASSLDGLSRWERAIARICLPKSHPIVPFQMFVLDMEQLLAEKPTRSATVPGQLLKAIGYKAMVVQARQILHDCIMGRLALASEASEHPLDPTVSGSDSPPPPAKSNADDARREYVAATISDFRHERILWAELRLYPLNWAEYITIDPKSFEPIVEGEALRAYIEYQAKSTFGCDFADILDEREDGVEQWEWFRREGSLRAQSDLHGFVDDLLRALVVINRSPKFCPDQPLPSISRLLAGSLVGPKPSPTAQSGHAYLRDNPPVSKAAREGQPSSSTSGISASRPTRSASAIVFSVTNKQLKLAERMFGERGGQIGWSELINLLKRLKFRVEGMGGSAHLLTSPSPDSKSMLLYRPHGSGENKFSPGEAVAIGGRLQRLFGWTIDNFARQPDIIAPV